MNLETAIAIVQDMGCTQTQARALNKLMDSTTKLLAALISMIEAEGAYRSASMGSDATAIARAFAGLLASVNAAHMAIALVRSES